MSFFLFCHSFFVLLFWDGLFFYFCIFLLPVYTY